MAKPTPGAPYTIVKDDTLSGIASQAYGQPKKWRDIWKANQTRLRSGDPNLIYPGEVINVPGLVEDKALTDALRGDDSLTGKDLDDFTLELAGHEYPVESAEVVRDIESGAFGFTATLANFTDNEQLREALRPKAYPKAKAYLGNDKAVEGIGYKPSFEVSPDSNRASIECWTPVADLVDSTIKPPYQESKITLRQRVEQLAKQIGIPVDWDDTIKDDVFRRVKCDKTEKIFDHLTDLARQRGALITSTTDGHVLVTRANVDGKTVGSLEEGLPPVGTIAAEFDGRSVFNSYRGIGRSPGKTKKNAVAKDESVPKSRFMTFQADDTEKGNIAQAAEWRRSKQNAAFLTLDVPVTSWYAPNGLLWMENTIVTFTAPTIYIDDGFDFLIRAVKYSFSDAGTTAVLSLVPPQVYTGEPIDEPWAK